MNKQQMGSRWGTRLGRIVAAAVLIGAVGTTFDRAEGFQIKTGNPDVKIAWDNTFKYNAAWRLEKSSDELTAGINQDDGDRNFDGGLFTNRINLLSELDMTYRRFGVRASGAAWYDTVYNDENDHDSPSSANQTSVRYDRFTDDTEKLHGRKMELLDAFVFGGWDIGQGRASFRAGRHTLLWGESVFFGSNGIANGQAPVDIQKAQSVPGTPFKELMRPVAQVSSQVQISQNITIGAYYQFEWEENRLPAVGSYFSGSDVVGDGGERLLAGPPFRPGGGPKAFFRGDDMEASDTGQYGLQLRFRFPNGETDYGLYAIRYHEKGAQIYTRPTAGAPNLQTGQLGTYQLVYPENVTALGASLTRTIENVNLAAEVSARFDTPLISKSQTVVPGTRADNDDNPLYAVGDSLHAQMSALWTVPRTPLFQEASFMGEVAWNQRTRISDNSAVLDPNTSKDAWGFRFTFTPTYRQALPGLDIGVPLGLGYNPRGRSSVVPAFNNSGVDEGGDVSGGLDLTYLDVWRVGLRYTHYFGETGPFLDATNARSFEQNMNDRDFVSFAISRTF
ncbi:MAG: DUF1302 domain-containing protein [Pseudomonadota bacterium]